MRPTGRLSVSSNSSARCTLPSLLLIVRRRSTRITQKTDIHNLFISFSDLQQSERADVALGRDAPDADSAHRNRYEPYARAHSPTNHTLTAHQDVSEKRKRIGECPSYSASLVADPLLESSQRSCFRRSHHLLGSATSTTSALLRVTTSCCSRSPASPSYRQYMSLTLSLLLIRELSRSRLSAVCLPWCSTASRSAHQPL
jgi:hypothetical protein